MSKAPFPWHFYILTVRSRVFFVVLAIAFTYATLTNVHGKLWMKILGILVVLIVASFVGSYFRILPFRSVLNRIKALQSHLPENLQLRLLNQKNEWLLLDQMLLLTEHYIAQQEKLIEDKNQQARLMIESIPNAIVTVDRYESILSYNQLFKSRFMPVPDAIEPEKIWRIFDGELRTAFRECLHRNQTIKVLAHFIPERNEFYDLVVTPILDSDQKLSGALGIFHNVTQSKLMEKMRVDFVANVSHEIRTPLTSIKGYAQLLQAHKQEIPEALLPILSKIDSNTEKLKDLFDNLMRLSVIESQQELTQEPVNFNELIAHVWSNLRAKYYGRDISLSNDFEAVEVKCDPKLMEQVLNNLFDNAIKYGQSPVRIQVNGGPQSDHTRITIKDNGPGIRNQELERIFERFYRVQGSTSKAIDGSGLGLSIVKHIINKHKGQINVSSAPGEGTSFTIILPL